MFSRNILKSVNRCRISRWASLNRSLLNVSSITVDTTISKCMRDEKPILPSDTSIFLFNDNVEENIRFLHTQIDIGKKMRIRVAPCALIEGKVYYYDIKVGLNSDDYSVIRSHPTPIPECSMNTIETMMERKETAFFTTSVTTWIASMLHCPIAISGFVRGLEKDSMQTSPDIKTLHNSHVTNVSCGFDVVCDVYSTVPFLTSNEISVVTPGCQYITSVNNRLLKVKSNITTYSYSELATLLLNNEQMNYPSTYLVGIHIKDTTRTAKLEKLMPSVFYESQRKALSFDDRSRFIHNCLNEKSNGLSKSLFCSCMKEVTKSGSILLKSFNEQKGAVHLKTLLQKEMGSSLREMKGMEVEKAEEKEPSMDEESPSTENDKNRDDFSYVTLYANMSHSQLKPSDANLSSSFFLSSISPSSPQLKLPEYSTDSPVLIGEIATGVYNQKSALETRPDMILRDVGGVMRNTYEVLLRHNPTKRPYLIGVVGNDEDGDRIMEYHEQFGDSLPGVRRVFDKTCRICGLYSKEGICEKEYRLQGTLKGVEAVDIKNNQERIKNSFLVGVDTSITAGAMTSLVDILSQTPNPLLVDPSHPTHYPSLIQSGLLARADYLLPSVSELWSLACQLQPSLEPSRRKWKDLITNNPSLPFHEAIMDLRVPLKRVMQEMKGDKDHFILLKMGKMGMAMVCQNACEKELDVIYFSLDKTFVPTFESQIAYEEAFAGGFMYGLINDYPMNLSMALGINTMRVNSRQKRIVADSINESIHNHFVKSYMKQLWG